MHVHLAMRGRGLPEIGGQFRVEIPDAGRRHGHVPGPERTSTQVDGDGHESFIHRKDHVPIAAYSGLVAQGAVDRGAQANSDVLGRMVRIDVEIAFAGDHQIEQSVLGEQFEHVIKEAYSGLDLGLAAAIKVEPETDLGFSRRSLYLGGSAGHVAALARVTIGMMDSGHKITTTRTVSRP